MNPLIKVLSFVVIMIIILFITRSCYDIENDDDYLVSQDTVNDSYRQSDQDNPSEAVLAVGAEIKDVKTIQKQLTDDTDTLKSKTQSINKSLQQLSKKVENLMQGVNEYANGNKRINSVNPVNSGIDILDSSLGSTANSISVDGDTSHNAMSHTLNHSYVWHTMDIELPIDNVINANNFNSIKLSNNRLLRTLPSFVIPSGTLIQAKTLTGMIGRIPVNGRVTDAWQFKAIAKGVAYAPNYQHLDLSGMVFEGVAQGDYAFRCARGRLHRATMVMPDKSVVTIKSEDDAIIAWLSDSYSNPCLAGQYVSNMKEALAKTTLVSAVKGIAESVAESERTNTVSADGVERSSVTGDTLRVTGADALSSVAGGVDDFVKQRIDTWDAIYVPAGQDVMIHISEELLFKLDKKKRLYEKQKIIANNGKHSTNDLD